MRRNRLGCTGSPSVGGGCRASKTGNRPLPEHVRTSKAEVGGHVIDLFEAEFGIEGQRRCIERRRERLRQDLADAEVQIAHLEAIIARHEAAERRRIVDAQRGRGGRRDQGGDEIRGIEI